MTVRILVAYASKNGSTREVAEAIAESLRERSAEVDCRSADEVRRLHDYDGVVLGGAIYTGRWHADALRLLKRHQRELASMPLAVYAMGPRTLDEADLLSSRAQLDAALAKVPEIEPQLVAIFGGVVDPAKLRFPFKHLPASDARDWDSIRAWAEELAILFGADRSPAPVAAALTQLPRAYGPGQRSPFLAGVREPASTNHQKSAP